MKGKKVLEIILFWSTMAYLLFFFLKHFVFAIYEVPSGSMLGTIWPGDYIITEKLSFGPRITWQNKQYRLPGVSSMERGDVLVFNFPEGDTVFVNNPAKNYYEQVRWNICKKEILRMYGKTTVLPVNYRVPYVKRCMGLPGDTLIIKNGEVNVCKSKNIWQIRNLYCVYSDLGAWNFIDSLPNYPADKYDGESCKLVALTSSESSELSKAFGIDSVVPKIDDRNFVNTFPFVKKKLVKWSLKSYGPICIPTKGKKYELNKENINIYRRVIEVYEGNKFKQKNDSIFINNEYENSYTFKQNYYFVMGDNRSFSFDSRNWGFVPEDHIIGKVFMIAFSKDRGAESRNNIRWSRIGKIIQ